MTDEEMVQELDSALFNKTCHLFLDEADAKRHMEKGYVSAYNLLRKGGKMKKVYVLQSKGTGCYVCEGGGHIYGVYANKVDAEPKKAELEKEADGSPKFEIVEWEVK